MQLERRIGYSEILKSLEDIKIKVAEVSTKVEERNNASLLWRNEVCGKFSEIKIYCQTRQASKLKVWLAMLAIVITGLVGWGETKNQVKVNTGRLVVIEGQLRK